MLGSTQEVSVISDAFQFTSDIAFQYEDFSFEGTHYYRTIDLEEPTAFGKQNAFAYFAQAGYFVIPKRLEVAAFAR